VRLLPLLVLASALAPSVASASGEPIASREAHAARIGPVSTSSPVAASGEAHAARIRPVSTSSPVAASTGWSQELERELMSPYCPGRSLIECPSPQATELRLWIQAQEREGVPRSQVEARLFEEFGDQLRHSPRAEGWGLWAYLVPGGALLAGGVVVVAFLGRGRPPGPPGAPPPGAPSDPELEREIDRELGDS
jgi:cytochrome c-type biogenesis protein CcmH/NrfF